MVQNELIWMIANKEIKKCYLLIFLFRQKKLLILQEKIFPWISKIFKIS